MQFSLSAQLERSFYTYDSKDGLNASHVYGIVQDTKGFMWIGTSTGLLKFDGVTFTSIDLPGLKNVEILELKIDDDDNLWFVNLFNQLCRYSIEDGLEIIELNEDVTLSNIWIKGDQIGVFRNIGIGVLFNRKTLERTELLIDNFKIPCVNEDLFITEDADKRLFLIDKDEKIELSNKHIFSPTLFFRFGKHLYAISSNHLSIYRIIKDGDEYYVEKVNTIESGSIINGISNLTDSLIYLNTDMGVKVYDQDFISLRNTVFPGKNATGSILDNENNFWVTSMNGGLIFSHNSQINRFNQLNDISISGLLKIDTSIFVGSNQGYTYVLNKKNSKILRDTRNEPVRFLTNMGDYTLIGFNSYVDHYENGTHISSNSYMSCQKGAAKLSESKILISTCFGYSTFEINQESELVAIDSVYLSRVFSIHKDENKEEILICTLDGVHKYRIRDGALIKNVFPKVKDFNIIDVEGSQTKTLWFATNNSGIFGIQDDEIKYHFTKDNLLNTNFINDLFIDVQNNLWISTSSGINVVNPEENTSLTITSKDGLNSDFVDEVYIENQNVYVGTSKGLNIFNRKVDFSNLNMPPIYLNSVIVNGDKTNLDNLNGQENTFRFNFQGINYSSLGKFKYKYRLKGLTDNWEIVPSSINEAIYNKIPPGDYTFEVLAINEDGVESLEPAGVSFRMPRPIYFRWWFILISMCFLIGLISWLFTRRLQQINRRNELEMNVRSQQLVALKAQMKPHFISNILNSIQSHSMLQDPIKVNQYITRLSKFVRKILNMSDAKVVALKDELEVIETYIELEQMRSNHSFEYKMNVDSEINQKRFFIPPMLIQPYVENAIKHGVSNIENGKITINVDKGTYGLVIVSIEDNGLGIDQNVKQKSPSNHISVGTKKNSSRLDLLRAVYKKTFTVKVIDLSKDTINKKGTQVQLVISNMSTIANA